MTSASRLAPAPAARPADPAGAAPAETRRRTPRPGGAVRALAHLCWPILLVLALWAAWVEFGEVPPAVAPAPLDVLAFIADNPGSFAGDALATVLIVAAGMALGTLAGSLLAAASWFSSVARSMIGGPALLTQCLPIVTLSPVLARVFGYGTATIVIIAALISFFPVLVFVTAGLKQTPPGADDLFRVLGAGRGRRFLRLAVPSALPRLLVALRMSVVAAVVGAMLAQWIMGASGLGYRLAVAQASFRTTEAWASSLVSIVLSVVLYSLVAAACRAAQNRLD